jgi:SAM-dependent methyltransferase
MIRLLGSSLRIHDANFRVLVVGAFQGELLDELKKLTSWQVAGIETNESAVLAARSRGHRIWACSPQDAFMTLPDGEVYDLLLVPAMLEHWEDPAWVLRRLIRLLKPTGRLVVRTPNLDSRLLELFGPTWWHWQPPYHRTLLGRKGLRELARISDMRVAKLRTVTDAYTASASVMLNRIGLAGKVPLGAEFPEEVAVRGSRLAGWARTLWDRWGRGDEMWAVLEMM